MREARTHPVDRSPAGRASGNRTPADRARETAYAVPLRVDRSKAPVYRLFNVGHEQLVGLTMTLLGGGLMAAAPPRVLDVGAAAEVFIRGDDLARRSVLVVRWFRPSGDEYLWRVSF